LIKEVKLANITVFSLHTR